MGTVGYPIFIDLLANHIKNNFVEYRQFALLFALFRTAILFTFFRHIIIFFRQPIM